MIFSFGEEGERGLVKKVMYAVGCVCLCVCVCVFGGGGVGVLKHFAPLNNIFYPPPLCSIHNECSLTSEGSERVTFLIFNIQRTICLTIIAF